MVKLFLVEDEIAMRDGIRKHIDWASEGIEFVGEASDGELAFPQICKLKPDIVLTDIKMPFVDGLELTEMIKKEMPGVQVIILSGYDEFEYARKAITLGVTEYLLKPIAPAKLLESIRKVKHKIEDERKSSVDWTESEQAERRELEKNKLFSALVMNTMSMAEILELGKKMDISLSSGAYAIILMTLRVNGEIGLYSKIHSDFLQEYAAVFSDKSNWYIFDRSEDGFAFLVTGDGEESVDDDIRESLGLITDIVARFSNAAYFIGVSKTVSRLSELRSAYYEANRAFAQRFFRSGNRIIYASDSEDNQKKVSDVDVTAAVSDEDYGKAMENFLNTGTYDEVEPFVDGIFDNMGEKNANSMIYINYVTMNLYLTMVRFAKEMSINVPSSDERGQEINTILKEFTGIEPVKAFLKTYLGEIIQMRDEHSDQRYGNVIKDVVSYIDENYAKDDISLNTVAAVANLSPNHLSTVFSKEMGVTFIEYLINKRMDAARTLLMTTNLRSSEIAYRVGYRDPHYFSYTFKKINGMTTREYKLRGKNAGEADSSEN